MEKEDEVKLPTAMFSFVAVVFRADFNSTAGAYTSV